MKIAILSGYKLRVLDSLLILKNELEKNGATEVTILGGIPEIQRIYYNLFKIQPDAVIVPQVLEKDIRNIAKYILRSGALVYVVPAEITIIKVMEDLLLNPDLKYNNVLTKMFVPGKRYSNLIEKSDISKNKIKIVGSPKIDVLAKKEGTQFYSRKKFATIFKTDWRKKNIFIFSSFVLSDENYIQKDRFFDKSKKQMYASNACVKITKFKYIEIIKKLLTDFPNHNIFLKPHPLEDVEPYLTIQYDNFRLVENMTIYNCFESTDLAIHWSSTVAPECWIAGIKTIQLSPYKKCDKFLSESHPGNPIARKYQDLKELVEQYISHKMEPTYEKFQKKYLTDNFYKIDGQSSKRISSIIINDLNEIKPKVKYYPNFNYLIKIVIWVEKVLGHKITQRIIGLFLKDYDWKTAAENYIDID